MKKIINAILLLGTAGTILFSCRPMDLDAHKLGAAPAESQLAFTATPSSSSANIIELANTSSVSGVALWDLGNGTTVKGDKVSATYPFKGDYTVTMSLYTAGGSATISKVVSITADDYGLLDTPGFSLLETELFEPVELKDSYPEFAPFEGRCYFQPCYHASEPRCAVREAVEFILAARKKGANPADYWTEATGPAKA